MKQCPVAAANCGRVENEDYIEQPQRRTASPKRGSFVVNAIRSDLQMLTQKQPIKKIGKKEVRLHRYDNEGVWAVLE